ncbi:MAG: pyridine nucleotide-disulfide oxidoreductase, partial [Acetobacteraceae bacterium]|nr:pyridine nucleotide-disulfide oxidoreductase [Acetobacteraceae bacterium]
MDASPPSLDARFATSDLATRDGLIRLDRQFIDRLPPDLAERLLAARAAPDALDAKAEGELAVALGPSLEAFVADLFGIADEIAAIAARTRALDPIHACKRLFVQRQAVKKYPDPAAFDGA